METYYDFKYYLQKTISLRIQPWLPQLIHASQTGFIKERSILDNIFKFWEVTALALKTKQDMAILLVDWGFLEGTLMRFGFNKEWIKGVAALYSGATSKVLLAGDKESPF